MPTPEESINQAYDQKVQDAINQYKSSNSYGQAGEAAYWDAYIAGINKDRSAALSKLAQDKAAAESAAQRNAAAKAAIEAARNSSNFLPTIFQYRDTEYGGNLFNLEAGAGVKNALQAAQSKNLSGSEINRLTHQAEFLFSGGTQKQFEDIVRQEERDIRNSRLASAGIKAGGVVQKFKQGFTPETKALGYSTTGPAETARQLQVISIKNQSVLDNNKISVNNEQLNKLGISSLYNTQPLQVTGIRPFEKTNKSRVFRTDQVSSSLSFLLPNGKQKTFATEKEYQDFVNRTVITPDNRVRTFKTVKDANKFLKNTEGSYKKYQLQGPVRPTDYSINLFEGTAKQKQNYAYTINLFEGTAKPPKEEEFKGPFGNLQYTYGDTRLLPIDQVVEDYTKNLDKFMQLKGDSFDPLRSIANLPLGLIQEGLVTVGGLRNLGLQATEYVTGHKSPLGLIELPRTATDIFIEKQGTGLYEGLTSGDTSKIYEGYTQADKALLEYKKKYGSGAIIGSGLFFALGVPKRILPIKLEPVSVPVGDINKAIGNRLVLGYGKASTSIATNIGRSIRLGKGESIYGNLAKTALAEVNPVGRGFELTTLKGAAFDILTSQKSLDILESAGKLGIRGGRAVVEKEIESAKLIGQIKIKPTQQQSISDILTATGGQLTEALKPGKETISALKRLIPSFPEIKGSFAQLTQVRPQFIYGTGRSSFSDFDVPFESAIFGDYRGLKLAKKTESVLNEILDQQRGARRSGAKVFTGIIEGVVFPKVKIPKIKKLIDSTIESRIFYHGDTYENLLNIKKTGIDLSRAGSNVAKRFGSSAGRTQEKLGIEGFYLAREPQYAASYSLTAVGKTKINPIIPRSQYQKAGLGVFEIKRGTKILAFKDIEKNIVANLRRQFPEFGDYQQSLIRLAKERGYAGIEKPVSAAPFGQLETAVLDVSRLKLKKILKPNSFVLSDEKKFLEGLISKDATTPSGSPAIQDLSRVARVKYPRGSAKIDNPYGGKITVRNLRAQALSKIASVATIQGPKTEKFRGTQADFLKTDVLSLKELESGFDVRSITARLKDVVDQPFLFNEIGTQGIESKKYAKQGKRLIELGGEIKDLFPYVDFGRPSGSVEIVPDSLIDVIGNSIKSISKTSKENIGSFSIVEKVRPKQQEKKQKSPSVKQTKSITSSINSKLLDFQIETRSSRVNSRVNQLGSNYKTSSYSIDSLSSFKIKSPARSPSRSLSVNIKSPIIKSPPSPKSPPRPPSPTSPPSPSPPYSPPYGPPYSPPTKSPPVRSPPYSPSIIGGGDLIIPPIVPLKRAGLLLFKFDQVKKIRLPQYAKKKFYIASPPDFLRAGVIAPIGVRELRSSSPKIFKQIDVNLARARRNKRSFDPLNGFISSKSGKYNYSTRGLLGKSVRIRI